MGFSQLLGLFELENGEEGLLRHLHGADLLHTLFAGFLFLKQFAFTRYVAAVAFGRHILAHGLDGFARDDFRTDGCLDGDVELVAGD